MKSIQTIKEEVRNVEGFDIDIMDGDIGQPYRPNKKLNFQFDYKRAAPSKLTVSKWISQRMPEDVRVVVFDNNGQQVHGRTTLNTVRSTYE